jgi:hypothetical protein
LQKLLSLDEIGGPSNLPVSQRRQSILPFQTLGLFKGVLLGFEDALVDGRALGERDPRCVRDIDQDSRCVRRHRSQVEKPSGGGRWIVQRDIGVAQRCVRAIVTIAAKVGAKESVDIRLELGEQTVAAKMLGDTSEVRPETLGNMRGIRLLEKSGESNLPLCDSFLASALAEINEREAIVNAGAAGNQFENVIVVGNGGGQIAGLRVIIGKLKIAFRGCGTLL